MIIQHRCFENFCFYVFLLLLIPYNKLFSGANSVVVGNGTTRSWCMENEREALLKFKQGLVDDYDILSSWGREEDKRDCCNWRGVKCDNRTGHVIALLLYPGDLGFDVFYQHLGGKIGPSLLELKHLTYLDLSYNEFQESRFPKFIGLLSKLRYLNLESCNFFGTIPRELGNLTNLRSLNLGADHPLLSVDNLEWLSNLRLLRKLRLSFIDLEKIDWLEPINKLSFLSELCLSSCNLPGIISPSLHSTNLSSIPLSLIDLSLNNFIPSSIYNWLFNFSSALFDIDIQSNPLGGSIPEAFGNVMTSLESLNLFNCFLEGEIPKSFQNLTRLQNLELAINNLNGSLLDFTRFSSLSYLSLDQNEFRGYFPKSFGQSYPLVSLSLSNNELNGSFPDLKSFPLLRFLDLSYNKLKGRVPESIGQLSNLEELSLSFNFLTLEFTSDWTPLFKLNVINLANCTLGPRFPEWLRSQNNLDILDISGAGIFDSIPYWFWDLSPKIKYLNISDNQIHGLLPNLSLKFFNLQLVDLRSNYFSGPIPLLPPNISAVLLSKNKFSGSIISLCTIATKFLKTLDLSNNLLTEVPDCWIHAEHLEILDLANNNFSGKIPTTFGFKSSLQILNLGNNNFLGKLPSSLKNCRLLEFIDMSENKLSGQVPAWIGTHLTSLVFLNFRINQLHGSIPLDMCHLNRTQFLDLSQNKISGNIPHCFGKLYSFIQTNSSRVTISFRYPTMRIKQYGQFYEYDMGEYVAGALVEWKGIVEEYRKTLGLLIFIDLSSNKLVGHIPQELANLDGLMSLNLSRNNLTGDIMQNVSRMKRLEVLDLSRNHLSGEIPTGLAELNFLSVLDLSNNNFSGKIPSSTQLQSFNVCSYAENGELCGLPLPNKCPGEDEPDSIPPSTGNGKGYTDEEDEDTFVTTGFYVSVVLGFAVGFWGFISPLLLQRSWRYAYFKFLEMIIDWIYVTIAVNMARLQREVRG